MKLPITAWASIAHRGSGAFLIVAVGVLIWLLDRSLDSEAGFAYVAELLDGGFAKLVLWGIVTALAYHTIAGVKHLVMDLGYGESMEGGVLGAKIVIGASALAAVIAGIYIW